MVLVVAALWSVGEPAVVGAPGRDIILYHPVANESVPDGQPEGQISPPAGTGPSRDFWVAAGRRGEYREVSTTLVGQTDTFRVWAQDSTGVSAHLMMEAAQEAERAMHDGLLATLAERALEMRPNLLPIDLVYAELSAMGGYFSSADQPGTRQHPYSNNTSAIYVSLAACSTSAGCSSSLIKHEAQHLLQYAVDPLEETWFNEGLSELAEDADTPAPLNCTDFELFGWSSDPDLTHLHYQSVAGFLSLWRDELGEEALETVAVDPRPGRESLSNYLAYRGGGITLDDLFLRWSVAQVAPAPGAEGGNRKEVAVCPNPSRHQLDATEVLSDTVSQYGCDLVLVPQDWQGQVEFRGSRHADLIPEFPPSNSLVWWSRNAATNHSTLTASVDLEGLQDPVLRYWEWHDIEEWYDWVYLEVSADGGATWRWLQAPGMTTKDPFGNSPGVGYTGSSGEWRLEEIDLGNYSGEEVLIRFGYLTDDAIEAGGFAVNHAEVVDRESGIAAPYLRWQSDGFRPLSPWVPQAQTMAVLALDAEEPSSYRVLPLDQSNAGTWPLSGDTTSALLVCGLTAEALPTTYELRGIADTVGVP